MSAILENRRAPDGRPDDTGRGWICFSAQDWWYHNQAHSDFQLMRELARDSTVLVVNSIGMRMPLPGRSTMPVRRVGRKLASIGKLLRRPVPELPGFHVMTPALVPAYGSGRTEDANAALIGLQVGLAARRLGISEPDIVATIPTAAPVLRRMEHRSLVFNRSDKHSAFGEADGAYIASLEDELLRTADRVLYVSRTLMDAESDRTTGRAVFLDHGVDTDHFRRRPAGDEPPDLAAIPHPRVGFFGGIDDYVVDLALLEAVALALPHAHLVLVGDATCSMQRLTSLPNVHWLGFRPYEDIPAYGSGFDVAIMPWLVNDWIEHCNPIKLKEYLALELPVVTTPFPGTERYAPLLDVADTTESFVNAVERALAFPGPRPGARAAVAEATWTAKARRVRELVDELGAG